jgi:hypothetical protein
MNTDTPETDAAYKNHAWDMHDHIPLEFARKLERERDEIRAQLREEQQLHIQTLNERDALRFAICTLKNAKGRFHTEQAATNLFTLIP